MDYKKRKLEEAQKLDQFFHALAADVERSLDLWCENGDEFSRKTHVRTAFALVEGMVQRFKAVEPERIRWGRTKVSAWKNEQSLQNRPF